MKICSKEILFLRCRCSFPQVFPSEEETQVARILGLKGVGQVRISPNSLVGQEFRNTLPLYFFCMFGWWGFAYKVELDPSLFCVRLLRERFIENKKKKTNKC